MDLSRRLTALADMVTPGSRLADVGCDHAHLPIRLCQENRIPSAIAMDVNPGPLERARENVEQAGLDDCIEIRLSDGLERLNAGEADCVVIAGMGGQLIASILKQKPSLLGGDSAVPELILGPHSEPDKVRKLLTCFSYHIVDEDFIEEDGKYYPIIKAQKARTEKGKAPAKTEPDPVELAFGPVLLRRRDPVLLQYLRRQEKQLHSIMDHLKSQDTENARNRMISLKAEEKLVCRALERIQNGRKSC